MTAVFSCPADPAGSRDDTDAALDAALAIAGEDMLTAISFRAAQAPAFRPGIAACPHPGLRWLSTYARMMLSGAPPHDAAK